MYSIVLAAVLTAGPATPNHFFGCHGCNGCQGSCHGCCGGCYGCSGCWGGCYGCYGGCYGCSGCYGGGWYSSCHGCCGGCYGCWGGCYGGCYGSGCYGCCGGYTGAVIQSVPATPVMPKASSPMKETGQYAPARVVVQAPADARILVNGQAVTWSGSEKVFATPALERGQTYSYLFEATADRDGKPVRRTARLLVRAGEETRVDFSDLTVTSAPTDSTRVTVQMPRDARLFVEGTLMPLTETQRTFETPKLEMGRAYTYTLRAEVVREGRIRSETQRVQVEAGKPLTVAFPLLDSLQASRR